MQRDQRVCERALYIHKRARCIYKRALHFCKRSPYAPEKNPIYSQKSPIDASKGQFTLVGGVLALEQVDPCVAVNWLQDVSKRASTL